MATFFALLFLSIAIIECMAGVLGFGIILAVSSSSCIRSKTWSPYYMIMISLSLSILFSQSWNILDLFFTIFFDTNYYKENMFSVLKTVFMFLNYSNLWFAAWLSVFYCIKVASYTQSSFIWLKQRLASLVPWMLITSSLYSIACTIPFTWAMCCRNNNYTAPLSTANSSETGVTSKDNLKLLIFLCNASIALPFILSVASSILLIRSLWIHTRQMQNNATGFRDPSLEAHMRAIKSVCSVLVLYIIYFISVLLIVFKVFEPLSTEEAVCIVVMAACPAVHAMILIWSNPKFRELPLRILHHINCHVRTRSM